jgi:hypothetical protein
MDTNKSQKVGKKLRIFLSSTYDDLWQHRRRVIDDLRKADFDVVTMEDFTANPEEPKTFSVEEVESCDLFILLVAFRRGFIPEGESKSITQLEYLRAIDSGRGVLVFQLEPDTELPQELRKYDKRKTDPELMEWRKTLEEKHIVEYFNLAPHSLNVLPAVIRWERH